jgi:thiol-disulfide isomerase/thioredoxin
MRLTFAIALLAGTGFAPALTAEPAAGPAVRPADAQAILGEVRKPGARGVLVNVWATWCDPCRAEMPGLLAFFREHRKAGLRLILVSADDEVDRAKVVAFLASQGVDFPSWMKQGDDMTFIDALDRQWSGALPASFLFDGRGRLDQRWYGEVSTTALGTAWRRLVPSGKGKRHDQVRAQEANQRR